MALDGGNLECQGLYRQNTKIPRASGPDYCLAFVFWSFCDILFILLFLATTRVGFEGGARSHDTGSGLHRAARRAEGVLNYLKQGGLF